MVVFWGSIHNASHPPCQRTAVIIVILPTLRCSFQEGIEESQTKTIKLSRKFFKRSRSNYRNYEVYVINYCEDELKSKLESITDIATFEHYGTLGYCTLTRSRPNRRI